MGGVLVSFSVFSLCLVVWGGLSVFLFSVRVSLPSRLVGGWALLFLCCLAPLCCGGVVFCLLVGSNKVLAVQKKKRDQDFFLFILFSTQ